MRAPVAILRAAVLVVLTMAGGGCGPRLDVGSDVLWTGLFEVNTFDEWTGDGAGTAQAFPAPPALNEISSERRVEVSVAKVAAMKSEEFQARYAHVVAGPAALEVSRD